MLIKYYLLIIVMTTAAFCSEKISFLGLTLDGWSWLSLGRIGSGSEIPDPEYNLSFSKMWLYDVNTELHLEKEFSEKLKARFYFGFSIFNLYHDPHSPVNKSTPSLRFAPYIRATLIERTFTFTEHHELKLEMGIIPVHYNPQAANLGEYLFRSSPYPAVMESGFELADKEKLTGLHSEYHFKFLDKSLVKLDDYLFINIRVFPENDISNALLLSTNLQELIEIGGGICWHSMISVDEKKTTPGKAKRNISLFPERYVHIDKEHPEDTTFYTFRGTKVMGRFTFNPRGLISSTIFGPEDLKIYGEFAVLGLKNYKGWYGNRSERIPHMIGFNFPTFKVLDVLSLQLQKFTSPYYNTWGNVWRQGSVVPYQSVNTPYSYQDWVRDTTSLTRAIHEDDWKWSIYMSKKIGNHFRLSLQLANDDLKKNKYMPPPPTQSKYTDVMGATWIKNDEGKELWGVVKDWYWMAKLTFYF